VQRQLFGQRVTQFGVVVDDQNFARVRHQYGILAAAGVSSMTRPSLRFSLRFCCAAWREIEH
jgi:hypothetical protein